ncbi:MAG: RraA family protein [Candidatus Korobacteraceae bacterium]
MQWQNDDQLFDLILSTLYTPVVGDLLDSLGFWHQFLPPEIQPLHIGMKLAGRAMPVQIADSWGVQEHPFGRLTDALDQIKTSEVYIATGGSLNCAAWGEILTATARMRGGAGAIIDGYHRDTPRVLEQNWPVFSRGRYAQDAGVRSSVVDFRCPIEIASVSIRLGDLVFGDLDGTVIIPKRVEEEVILGSLKKARGEKLVRKEIEAGASSAETFAKYGIL